MLTLEQAIEHCHEKAEELKNMGFDINTRFNADTKKGRECYECATEHEQLASWLEELKERREADRWISVKERLPEEKINPNTEDLEEVLCSTIWGDVRAYKFGKPIHFDTPHFWYACGIMDKYVTHWRYLPKPYDESEGK